MGEVAVRAAGRRWVRVALAGIAVAGLLGGAVVAGFAGSGSAPDRPALADNGIIIVEN